VSAVLAPRPPLAAEVADPERSCTQCRRHRAAGDTLRCTEQRSNAVGGVIVAVVSAAKQAGTYEQIAINMADRCRFYQEER